MFIVATKTNVVTNLRQTPIKPDHDHDLYAAQAQLVQIYLFHNYKTWETWARWWVYYVVSMNHRHYVSTRELSRGTSETILQADSYNFNQALNLSFWDHL